jgi:hypothetical protein
MGPSFIRLILQVYPLVGRADKTAKTFLLGSWQVRLGRWWLLKKSNERLLEGVVG